MSGGMVGVDEYGGLGGVDAFGLVPDHQNANDRAITRMNGGTLDVNPVLENTQRGELTGHVTQGAIPQFDQHFGRGGTAIQGDGERESGLLENVDLQFPTNTPTIYGTLVGTAEAARQRAGAFGVNTFFATVDFVETLKGAWGDAPPLEKVLASLMDSTAAGSDAVREIIESVLTSRNEMMEVASEKFHAVSAALERMDRAYFYQKTNRGGGGARGGNYSDFKVTDLDALSHSEQATIAVAAMIGINGFGLLALYARRLRERQRRRDRAAAAQVSRRRVQVFDGTAARNRTLDDDAPNDYRAEYAHVLAQLQARFAANDAINAINVRPVPGDVADAASAERDAQIQSTYGGGMDMEAFAQQQVANAERDAQIQSTYGSGGLDMEAYAQQQVANAERDAQIQSTYGSGGLDMEAYAQQQVANAERDAQIQSTYGGGIDMEAFAQQEQRAAQDAVARRGLHQPAITLDEIDMMLAQDGDQLESLSRVGAPVGNVVSAGDSNRFPAPQWDERAMHRVLNDLAPMFEDPRDLDLLAAAENASARQEQAAQAAAAAQEAREQAEQAERAEQAAREQAARATQAEQAERAVQAEQAAQAAQAAREQAAQAEQAEQAARERAAQATQAEQAERAAQAAQAPREQAAEPAAWVGGNLFDSDSETDTDDEDAGDILGTLERTDGFVADNADNARNNNARNNNTRNADARVNMMAQSLAGLNIPPPTTDLAKDKFLGGNGISEGGGGGGGDEFLRGPDEGLDGGDDFSLFRDPEAVEFFRRADGGVDDDAFVEFFEQEADRGTYRDGAVDLSVSESEVDGIARTEAADRQAWAGMQIAEAERAAGWNMTPEWREAAVAKLIAETQGRGEALSGPSTRMTRRHANHVISQTDPSARAALAQRQGAVATVATATGAAPTVSAPAASVVSAPAASAALGTSVASTSVSVPEPRKFGAGGTAVYVTLQQAGTSRIYLVLQGADKEHVDFPFTDPACDIDHVLKPLFDALCNCESKRPRKKNPVDLGSSGSTSVQNINFVGKFSNEGKSFRSAAGFVLVPITGPNAAGYDYLESVLFNFGRPSNTAHVFDYLVNPPFGSAFLKFPSLLPSNFRRVKKAQAKMFRKNDPSLASLDVGELLAFGKDPTAAPGMANLTKGKGKSKGKKKKSKKKK